MKATITKTDGTSILLEGTPAEIREVIQMVPTFLPTPTPIIEQQRPFNPMCPAHNGQPWFGIYPPACTCNGGFFFTKTTDNTNGT